METNGINNPGNAAIVEKKYLAEQQIANTGNNEINKNGQPEILNKTMENGASAGNTTAAGKGEPKDNSVHELKVMQTKVKTGEIWEKASGIGEEKKKIAQDDFKSNAEVKKDAVIDKKQQPDPKAAVRRGKA